MKIGIKILKGIDVQNQVKYMKDFGVNRTFMMSDAPDFDNVIQFLNENDIICETLHAPFNKINNMWSDDEEAGDEILSRLKDSVNKCEKYNIPVTVVHVSSGRPMPEINEQGIKRYEEIFRYAESKGIIVALENLRYLENLEFFMNRYKTPGFCWDIGHENCYTKGIKYMDLFGDRLSALHIHDNRCIFDIDDHLLPFDGKIDFEEVAKFLGDSGYDGTIMLEVSKYGLFDREKVYECLSDEEFIKSAVSAARRLADMVDKYKKA